MTITTGFLILAAFTLVAGVSALWVYRPRSEDNPAQMAVGPFATGFVAFFASFAAGAFIGLILGSIGSIVAVLLGSTDYWSGIAFGVLFIPSIVFGAIITWHNAFPEKVVAVGNGGVVKFLKKRIYFLYLKEGAHRLPLFLDSQDVDLTLQIGKQLDFEEPAKDHALVGISLFWEYRIANPARSLSIGSIKEKISPTFDKLAQTGSRTYVRGHETDALLMKSVATGTPATRRYESRLRRSNLHKLISTPRASHEPPFATTSGK